MKDERCDVALALIPKRILSPEVAKMNMRLLARETEALCGGISELFQNVEVPERGSTKSKLTRIC
jgi:hypothetical protein